MAAALPAERARRGRLAATLTILGTLGLANFVGMDFLVWRMASAGADSRSELLLLLQEAAQHPAVIGPASALLALLGLGLIVFSAELRRAGVIARVPAALLAGGLLPYAYVSSGVNVKVSKPGRGSPSCDCAR